MAPVAFCLMTLQKEIPAVIMNTRDSTLAIRRSSSRMEPRDLGETSADGVPQLAHPRSIFFEVDACHSKCLISTTVLVRGTDLPLLAGRMASAGQMRFNAWQHHQDQGNTILSLEPSFGHVYDYTGLKSCQCPRYRRLGRDNKVTCTSHLIVPH